MTELFGVIVLGTPLVAIVVVVVTQKLAQRRRRRAMRRFAAARAWQWVGDGDQAYAHRWNGEPFAGGRVRVVRNVVTGRQGEYEFNAFDYQHKTGSGGARGKVVICTVWTLRLPASLPPLAVGPEGVFGGRVAGVAGRGDVQTESEEFNRAFRVEGDDRYAMAVLHPRMMELLLSAPRTQWRIERDWLVYWEPGRAEPERIALRLGLLAAIAGLIPSYVLKDYGR